jgi:hypothetical protein
MAYYPYVGTLYSFDSFHGRQGDCSDVTGLRDTDNPFYLNVWDREFPICSGDLVVGRWTYTQVRNYVLTAFNEPIPNAEAKAPTMDWPELAWKARQFTDPQRPVMSLPQFIGEAGDLPGMLMSVPELLMKRGRQAAEAVGRRTRPRPRRLPPNAKPPSVWGAARDAARQTAGDVGSQYVGAQFGWAPVMRDLEALLALSRAIAQRLEWLLRLLQGYSIRRRMMLPNFFEPVFVKNRMLNSAHFTVYGEHVDMYRVKHWVTSRWGLSALVGEAPLPSLDDPDGLIALAARLATGMNKNGLWEAWWELLPWSWLIDWWFNIGRLLAALLPGALWLNLESLCYCRTCQVQRFYTVTSHPNWLTFSGPPARTLHVAKWRKDIKPFLSMEFMRGPTLGFPDLNPGQWAILAGLLAQKLA